MFEWYMYVKRAIYQRNALSGFVFCSLLLFLLPSDETTSYTMMNALRGWSRLLHHFFTRLVFFFRSFSLSSSLSHTRFICGVCVCVFCMGFSVCFYHTHSLSVSTRSRHWQCCVNVCLMPHNVSHIFNYNFLRSLFHAQTQKNISFNNTNVRSNVKNGIFSIHCCRANVSFVSFVFLIFASIFLFIIFNLLFDRFSFFLNKYTI